MDLAINSTWKLNNGSEIPILGLGTWDLRGRKVYQAVLWAFDIGYRLIDTATLYGNEREIGEAMRDSALSREDIFLTTKVWNTDQGFKNTLNAIEKSLKRLQTDYVDLYLIHWPVSRIRNETWRTLEKIYEEGKAHAIGVSNYTISHLEELMRFSETIPAVNQIEFSPFLYQKELMNYCKTKNIALEAYTPLTRGRKFNNRSLKSISQKYDKTVAQILIRWGLQHEIIEIPRSGNQQHLHENATIFDFTLDEGDMTRLDELNEDFRLVDDPHSIE
ncbi:MAG: aldo/keto reductase [Promethearchaeota archaeon]